MVTNQRRGTADRYGRAPAPHEVAPNRKCLQGGCPNGGLPINPNANARRGNHGRAEISAITLHTGVSSHEVETQDLEDQVLYAEPFEVPEATRQRSRGVLPAARR